MALLRSLFWLALFLGSMFVFTVIFEYGPRDFTTNAKKTYETFTNYVKGDVKRQPDKSDKLLR